MKWRKRIGKFWKLLGPGLITGASDDDPSGIATYSQAGARFGTGFLWTALLTYPLMIAMQEMSARIGLVTGEGLLANIKKHYPRPVLYAILLVSFPSIVLNIGADIAGMGAVGHMLFPAIPSYVFAVVFTGLLMYAIIQWNYRKIATVLKWLCITLLSYLLIPFFTHTSWTQVVRDTFVPHIEFSTDYLFVFVGILGTTISPYLFFWQASMEVEEENEQQIIVDKTVISNMNTDVKWGMLLTNVVFYFILLTTGTVLFREGIHEINTVQDAARALQPLAGEAAYILFALGVLGTGFLAIPVLAGSLSYMLAETFNWEEGMSKKFHEARGFYLTLILSLLVGLSIEWIGISPVQALLYTAVLYGLIAPVVIAAILHMCNNPKIMGEYKNRRSTNFWGLLTLLLMVVAGVVLIVLTLGSKSST